MTSNDDYVLQLLREHGIVDAETVAAAEAAERPLDKTVLDMLLENGAVGLNVTKDRSTYFCKLTQMYYIESVDKHTYIYTKGDCYECRERLYELEEKLGTYFVRISKSMIVNLRKIQNVSAEPGGRMVAVLLNAERVIISRSYVKEIKRRLGIQ